MESNEGQLCAPYGVFMLVPIGGEAFDEGRVGRVGGQRIGRNNIGCFEPN